MATAPPTQTSTPNTHKTYGVLVPSAPPTNRRSSTHPRFRDIKAFTRGVMPTVHVGEVWEDLDPRCAGRTIQILKVDHHNADVMVRTLTPRTGTGHTPSAAVRDTTGDITWVARRRFRENSRGYRYLGPATDDDIRVFSLAYAIACAYDRSLHPEDVRTAEALTALLGHAGARDFTHTLRKDAERTNSPREDCEDAIISALIRVKIRNISTPLTGQQFRSTHEAISAVRALATKRRTDAT